MPLTGTRRSDTALSLGELHSWVDELRAIDNPIRREFHLFLLLSGSRPDAVKRAKIDHVNFRTRILHMPKPKGGEVKAFDIPLSRAMIRCLVRAMRLGPRVRYIAHREYRNVHDARQVGGGLH